ncbi:MAG: hypothetical protein RLZZ396_1044 [Planctomycetota bacterium]|jgi:hypothetical protein
MQPIRYVGNFSKLRRRLAPIALAFGAALCLVSTARECSAQQGHLQQLQAIKEFEEGSSSRETRTAAIRSLPIQQLTPEAGHRIQAVVDDVSYFRRMPAQTVESDPDMYRFLVRHPEVVVNIWDLMGITKVTLSRVGEYQLAGNDGAGTTCKLDLVYGSDSLHIYYCDGFYDGNLWPRSLRGQCVVALYNRPVKLPDGRPGMVAWMDAFMRIENAGADLIVKTLGPLVAKTADQNFIECASFISQVSQTARVNPQGLQQVASRLTKINPEVRSEFMKTSAVVSMRSSQTINSQQAVTQGIATSTRKLVQKRTPSSESVDPDEALSNLGETESPTIRMLTSEGAFDPPN